MRRVLFILKVAVTSVLYAIGYIPTIVVLGIATGLVIVAGFVSVLLLIIVLPVTLGGYVANYFLPSDDVWWFLFVGLPLWVVIGLVFVAAGFTILTGMYRATFEVVRFMGEKLAENDITDLDGSPIEKWKEAGWTGKHLDHARTQAARRKKAEAIAHLPAPSEETLAYKERVFEELEKREELEKVEREGLSTPELEELEKELERNQRFIADFEARHPNL